MAKQFVYSYSPSRGQVPPAPGPFPKPLLNEDTQQLEVLGQGGSITKQNSSSSDLYIGKEHQGGIIFYLFSDNSGLVVSKEHAKIGEYGFSDLNNLDDRLYSTFRNSNGNQIGRVILDLDFILTSSHD